MAAGLGFKDFATGEVLTAADVDGYLMQGIWVFASNAARDAAVTAPAEGNFAFTKDTNSLWYYDGAAWVASGATGDIEGVTAGVGISGGGTSGTVTVTNSMATAIDAKGDLVVGTGADTFSKLTVGANGTTLVADSAEATGLKWAAPAGGSTFAGADVWQSVAVSMSNNTQTAMTWTNENFDTDSYHSTSTNTSRMTIPAGKGGKYLVTAQMGFNANTTGFRDISVFVNGTKKKEIGWSPLPAYPQVAISAVVEVVATDYIEIFCKQDSGSTQATDPGQSYAWFTISYLGA